MEFSPADREEKIRALNYLLKVLRQRYNHALRAMQAAVDPTKFNEALRQARDVDEQIDKYRDELFDLTEAR